MGILFSYKRVTDPQVFLTVGPALAVTLTFDPTGSDARLQIFSFILNLVNLPFNEWPDHYKQVNPSFKIK
jgi:hypothetical protein